MASLAHHARHPSGRRHHGHRRHRHNPLGGPLVVFAAAAGFAALYVGYVLWPRWPEAPVALDAPSIPIVIADAAFNVEPAAIREAMQRRPGTQMRVDLVYLWPSLTPPGPATTPTLGQPVHANDRLFVTIRVEDGTLALGERLRSIYPRYQEPEERIGPDGLGLRPFRDDSPYRGEDLLFDPADPASFAARCSRSGVSNAGTCLLERQIGGADITFRFPRDWLADWKSLRAGIDRLLTRLHPGG